MGVQHSNNAIDAAMHYSTIMIIYEKRGPLSNRRVFLFHTDSCTENQVEWFVDVLGEFDVKRVLHHNVFHTKSRHLEG